jgi:hypothetical protein
MYFKIKT